MFFRIKSSKIFFENIKFLLYFTSVYVCSNSSITICDFFKGPGKVGRRYVVRLFEATYNNNGLLYFKNH